MSPKCTRILQVIKLPESGNREDIPDQCEQVGDTDRAEYVDGKETLRIPFFPYRVQVDDPGDGKKEQAFLDSVENGKYDRACALASTLAVKMFGGANKGSAMRKYRKMVSRLNAALKAAGFAKPSPIQAQAWPVAVAGKDMVAIAKTGSGKTVGFLLPAFSALNATMPSPGSTSRPGTAMWSVNSR